MSDDSRIPGFYRKSLKERLELIARGDESLATRLRDGAMSLEQADAMVENVIGRFQLPLGMAVNFLIDGKDYCVPMVVEEPSVIAAASHAAKLVRDGGGFTTEVTPSVMVGQIQLVHVTDPRAAKQRLEQSAGPLIDKAKEAVPRLVKRGGGPRKIEIREIPGKNWLVVHVHVDCLDAMGANMVNTVCEFLAAPLADIANADVGLRILTNLCEERRTKVSARVPLASLRHRGEGADVAKGVALASEFAAADPYRAATHNKGLMNGVDAVLLATGNDWRGVEAGAHAFAARSGQYAPLSSWRLEDAFLVGELDMPLAVATVGGALHIHQGAQDCLDLLGISHAADLCAVVASVGLASNLAALLALSTEGIQRGHMALHARKVALAAGIEDSLLDQVAETMAIENNITEERARDLAERCRQESL